MQGEGLTIQSDFSNNVESIDTRLRCLVSVDDDVNVTCLLSVICTVNLTLLHKKSL